MLITLILLGELIFMLSACENANVKQYSITTSYKLLNIDEEKIYCINTDSQAIDIKMNITYQSDVPFEIEIMMLDNYEKAFFEIKKEGKYVKDDKFNVRLQDSKDEITSAEVVIRISNINKSMHDVAFLIKNITKLNNNSQIVYDILRLGINTGLKMKQDYNLNIANILPNKIEQSEFLHVTENKKSYMNCFFELAFDIEKIYLGEKFKSEYEQHQNDDFPFIIFVIQGDEVQKINDCNYLYGKIKMKDKVKIDIEMEGVNRLNGDLFFVLVPYPYTGYLSLDRYEKIAYNNVFAYRYCIE